MSKRLGIPTIGLVAISCLAAFLALLAAPGAIAAEPSPTFGVAGQVKIPGISKYGFSDVAEDRDGNSVVAATQTFARLSPDGQLDTAFGEGGIARGVLPYFTSLSGYPSTSSIAFQPDGKLVISGNYGPRPFIARIDQTGVLDPTFARNGLMMSRNDFWNHPRTGYQELAIDSKGRIVVAGPLGDRRTVIARYLSNGDIDRSFGRRGRVTFLLKNQADNPNIGGLLVLPRDRVFAIETRTRSVRIHRLTSRGDPMRKPKLWFSAHWPLGAEATLLRDGSVLGSFGENGFNEPHRGRSGPIVFRIRPNGYLDRRFGNRGVTRYTSNRLTKAFRPCGRLSWGLYGVGNSGAHGAIVSGHTQTPGRPSRTLAFRLTRRGSIDRTFGDGGAFFSKSFYAVDPMPIVGLEDGSTLVTGGARLGDPERNEQFLYRFDAP